jgi:hypothetical protein
MLSPKYRALKSGDVVYDGTLIYESLEQDGISGKDIARILNEFSGKGIELDWDALSDVMKERGLLPT